MATEFIEEAEEPQITRQYEHGEDSFFTYDERQMVHEELSRTLGERWKAMDMQEKEQMVRRYSEDILKEVAAMAGGIWDGLDTEQKRELFRARFVDRTVPAPEREEAFAVPKKAESAFPGFEAWVRENDSLLTNMTPAEKEALYRLAAERAAQRVLKK